MPLSVCVCLSGSPQCPPVAAALEIPPRCLGYSLTLIRQPGVCLCTPLLSYVRLQIRATVGRDITAADCATVSVSEMCYSSTFEGRDAPDMFLHGIY